MVLQDAAGTFLVARAVHLGPVRSALCAEAEAWRAALEFAMDLWLNDIIVEGDSQQIVSFMNKKARCLVDVEVNCGRYQAIGAVCGPV